MAEPPGANAFGCPWPEALSAELEARREADLYRWRVVVDGPQGAEIQVDGAPRLSFCSNDYLGLAGDPRLGRALTDSLETGGFGSGASHLVTGHCRSHQRLEEALAAFCRRPRALLFSTGYMANVGTLCALLGRGDAVFADRLVHASLIDGALLSKATLKRFAHRSVDDLDALLGNSRARRKLVVTDGVFSMDGDLAPLPQLARVCARHGAWLMVDDAHGFGVLGEEGRGSIDHFALDAAQVPVLVGTLGKAFGTFGAFVAGDDLLIDTLIQKSRPYIYTTALPPGVAAASLEALELVRGESWRRAELMRRVAQFRRGAGALGLALPDSETPIQPLVLGDAGRALEASRALSRAGIHVTAIRPPTVPRGGARLRVTLSARHSAEHVDRLIDALAGNLPGNAPHPPGRHGATA